jgi:hypothetical protein
MLFCPDDHADGGDGRRYAGAAVVRPHRCPESACGTCAANCSDGDGELSLQEPPVLWSRSRHKSRYRSARYRSMTPMIPMPYGLWDDEYFRTRRSAEAVTLLCQPHSAHILPITLAIVCKAPVIRNRPPRTVLRSLS